MIWILIVYLAGFAVTLIEIERENVRWVIDFDRAAWGAERELSVVRSIFAALAWFLTVPAALFIAWKARRLVRERLTWPSFPAHAPRHSRSFRP